MTEPDETTNASSSDDLYDLLIEAVDALEQSWRSLNNAELAEYLPAPQHPHRVRVLAELVKIDQEHRWKSNEQKLLEQYLKDWPELTGNKAVVVDLIRSECVTRERFGRRARYFDIKRRFPEHHRYINLLAIHAEAKGRTASSRAEMEEADEQLLTPGYRLAGFEIIDLLGSGGMALVYRAKDIQLEREVAVKVPTFTLGPDSKTAERMLREARLAAKIEHPHVCPILGADNTNGLAYIAMALIDGQPLSEWLDNHELPSPAAAHLIMKVAEALQKVHEAGIVHRDIKASNVMIDDRSEPILMDFGLAHAPDFESTDEAVVQRTETVTPQPVDPKSRSWRTTASMFGGTVAYMAPERLQGKPADRQSDIYSLGVLFYQALTGRLPFLGDDVIEVSEKILSSEPPLPRTFRPDIEPYLESICLKAMSRNIETRYPTAASLAKSIYGHLRRTGYLQPELRGRDSDQEKEEDTTTDRPPESRFGKYEIRQIHGSDGRFAEYVAYDTDLQRDVVLLVSSSIATEQNGDELLSAIKTMSKCKHAGIGRVYDSGTIDGRAFITLPVARGERLSAWQNRKDVTSKDLAGVLSKVALALNELVSVGIAPDYSQLESTLVNDRKEPVLSPLLAVSNASENRGNSDPHDSTPHDDVVDFGRRCYKLLTGQELPPVASSESRRAWRGTLFRKLETIGYPLADICVRAMDDRPGHGYDTLPDLAEALDACSRGRRKVGLPRLTHLFHGYDTLRSLAEARVAFSRRCRKLKVPRLNQLLVTRIRRTLAVLVLAVLAGLWIKDATTERDTSLDGTIASTSEIDNDQSFERNEASDKVSSTPLEESANAEPDLSEPEFPQEAETSSKLISVSRKELADGNAEVDKSDSPQYPQDETPVSPEELISVTIEIDNAQGFVVVPPLSLGADVVNGRGQGAEQDESQIHGFVERITFKCLPGTVARLLIASGRPSYMWPISLRREDDEQVLNLEMDGPYLYSNDACIGINFVNQGVPGGDSGASRIPSGNSAVISSMVEVPPTLRSIKIGVSDEYLPVIRRLKNSHVDVCMHENILFRVIDVESGKLLAPMSAELATAIADVHARYLEIASQSFELFPSQSESLENLTLAVPTAASIPDLAAYKSLRFLTIIGPRIDLSRIQGCRKLQALCVFSKDVENLKAISVLRRLQFLTFFADSETLHTIVSQLPNLQYLCAMDSSITDLSFAKDMQFLQTLCLDSIPNQESLRMLIDAPSLKCLAVSVGHQRDVSTSQELAAFKKARPDVSVVKYDVGVCLGSFWLAPLSFVIALLASFIRIWMPRRKARPGWTRTPQNPRSTLPG